jgi:hypothetical protein
MSWKKQFKNLIKSMPLEWRKNFKCVICHLKDAINNTQTAYCYPIFCRKIGKYRIHQVSGFKFIYRLLKPKVYTNMKNEYCMRVKYDYIKLHHDCEQNSDLPNLNDSLSFYHFQSTYGSGSQIKFYKDLGAVMMCYAKGKIAVTYYKHKIELTTLDNQINYLSSPASTLIQMCLEKIYEKRKKEFYENQVLELAQKFRIKKKVRLQNSNVKMILNYLS